ncbi:hypothetical protein BH11PLA2_BH11PLA2_47800 [soil metagenome]
MTEYVLITLVSATAEAEAAFKGRIAAFWTHMVRNQPDEYEKMYAEATKFVTGEGCLHRQYMAEAGVIEVLTRELTAAGLAFEPVDEDDLYSKYEATPPDWFWIEH